MRKVLVTATNYERLCQDGLQLLRQHGCEVDMNPHSRPYAANELHQAAADADAVIASVEAWNEPAFQAAPRVKVIARFGTGVDSVDFDAARRHGVVVTNTPGLNAPAVAEHAVGLLLSLMRSIPQLNQDAREGKWTRTIFSEIGGKTVGILGFGNIGQQFARVLSGFNVNLVAYNRSPREAAARALNVTMRPLEDVIRSSDILSIHLPNQPETRHLINAERIAHMKDGVIIINTARGPLVDEQAVREALISGKIAGLASDVFEQEPVTADYPLFSCPNYICTPHSAGETYQNYAKTGLATAQAVIDVLEGREPQNRRA